MHKQTTCCFTGPIPHKPPFLANPTDLRRDMLKQEMIAAVIDRIVNYGCNIFLCGMAQGADMLFAEVILELKEIYADCVRLVCVLPYEAQAARWPYAAQARYQSLLAQADECILLQKEYTNGCLLARNRFMVEHSSCLIAVYDGASGGGTGYTVAYAKKKSLHLVLLDPVHL